MLGLDSSDEIPEGKDDFYLYQEVTPVTPLVASTQMHNDRPDKVAFLEQVGFTRAILARELSLPQVRAIRAATQIELEYFCHGALCVCYSGQCYMSYAIGGRSGNRGDCAQPCRLPYAVRLDGRPVDVGRDHPLSPADLLGVDHVRALIDGEMTAGAHERQRDGG